VTVTLSVHRFENQRGWILNNQADTRVMIAEVFWVNRELIQRVVQIINSQDLEVC
jgi:hypothetical protein